MGRLTVQSLLGQPLRAEVEVTAVTPEEAASLNVRLASQALFRQANLDFNPALAVLRFSLERRTDSTFVVTITSLQPVNEPFLELLLELNWSTGRVLREYTVLLDPPGLRAPPQVIAPITAQPGPAQLPPPAPVAAAPAPAPAEPAPLPPVAAAAVEPAPAEPTPAPAPAPQPEPAPAPGLVSEPPAATASAVPLPEPAQAEPAAPASYTVKRGDTLSKIAQDTRPGNVSLDQMLVAMFRANPNAFAGNNMNRLLAGRTLTIPNASQIEGIGGADARAEVVAQTADFNQYRSRLAQAATGAPAVVAEAPAAAGGGRVTTQVQDQTAPTKGGDQLKIAKADAPATAGAAAAAAAKQDEAVARQRALKEQEERAAELKKTTEALKKAVELQSQAGAQAQKQAEAKTQAEAKKPEPAAVPAPTKAAEPVKAEPAKAPEPVKAEAPKAEPAKVEPAKAEPPKAEPVKAEAPKAEAKKPAPPPPPPAPPAEESFTDMLSSPLVLGGGVAALLVLLIGLNIMRKRRVERSQDFATTSEGLGANSLFGGSGGQSVDTGATSTFNSSFIPAASQLDSNEVDPVAEADVYIAYGREEQAEDILKEALRTQPDRHAVRLKLLEIYSRRGDKSAFNAVAQELRERTNGVGEDWDRAVKLGRALDPASPMFAGAGGPDSALRGPTTELRLNPGGDVRPATLNKVLPPASPPPAAGPATTPRKEPLIDFGFLSPPPAATPANTRGGPDTKLEPAPAVDSRLSAQPGMVATTPAAAPMGDILADFKLDTAFGAPPPPPPAPPPAPAPSREMVSLDFDLGGAGKAGGAAPPAPPPPPSPSLDFSFDFGKATAAPAPALDLGLGVSEGPRTAPGGMGAMPKIDLDLPPAAPPAPAPAFSAAAPRAPLGLDETLSRPTMLGDAGGLPDEVAPRLMANTDQATVPLIDFDLSGTEIDLGGRRTETPAGSPLAAQMATKLDLARGYIDLGVKDGARELLEEVMRDGTRDQRQQAVELMKQVEA